MRSVGDIADDLREADDMDADVGGLVFRPDVGFKRRSHLGVIEPLPGLRVDLQQGSDDDRARVVIGHQLADATGFDDVLTDAFEACGGGLEVHRNDAAALESILHDLDVANVGRENGTDLGAIDAGNIISLIGDFLQLFEKFRREDVASGRGERDDNPVGAAKLNLILLKRRDVVVIGGELFGEARIDMSPGGKKAEHHRHQGEKRHGEMAVTEDEILEPFHARRLGRCEQ